MLKLKVRKFGNSLGFILPKEAVNTLHIKENQEIFAVESGENSLTLTPYDPGFEDKMKKLDDIIARYPNTLKILSE